ncbi:hypothetical protein [Methanosphaerula palustris]|uniref:Uncharacterized protein n=1 Tax=Methanosphaerula palustris (strain ATCC BAA-1556 / DSM 19958 / E1-9c) TaxID=521011 RepID=B8GKG5_METPE|nr:hypothetical protein [Methanosphaerula palustris]ACL15848.1 hypothetical protein Mpal_0474 [Methanosphaerula palustris E1-9c]
MDECPTEAITTTINLRGLASGLLILPLDELDAEKTAALTEVLSTYD